jgi:subtilase family serine protease
MSARLVRLTALVSAAATLLIGGTPATAASSMSSYAKLKYDRPLASPQGFSAAQLRSAYHATSNGSAKVAIVTAYGDPGIKDDLDKYSRTMGLPLLPNCSSKAQTSCFEKTDQRGGQRFPRADAGWGLETALDVEAVHAMCPGCRIELVQADTASTTDLLAAVDQAVASGAGIVSMSWGGAEFSGEASSDRHFQPAGVTFVASSGDSGYGTSWPAASNQVIAVGGTHLQLGPNGRAGETVWAGSGSGCSRYEAKPAWQHDAGCKGRMVADVSADADPASGAAIATGLGPNGAGWYTVGGTSLAAPLVAGLIGLAGGGNHATIARQLYTAVGTARLYDVSSGSNGACSPAYLCTAASGYDGPTGVGTPNGPAAF